MATVKAKFRCNSVTDFGGYKRAKLSAVYSQAGENADYAKATPNGDLEIGIDQSTPAINYFQPGKEYYLVFDDAPSNNNAI